MAWGKVRAVFNPRYGAWLIGIVLASGLPSAPLNSETRCCRLVRTSFGYVSLAPRDVSLGIRTGNEVARAAREILRIPDARFAIVDARHSKYHWADTTPDGLAVYPWSFVHGTDYVAVQPPNSVLPHEIGHDLLRRYVIPATHPAQYGTDAPDWLDEAVAVAFETPEDQAQRRCEASSLLKSNALIPLRRFLTMDHPDLAANQKALAGGPARTFVFDSSASKDTPAFYAMSIAFPEYLAVSTHSPAVLAEVIDAFRAGRSLEEWLPTRLRASSQDFGIEKMDQSFSGWLRSDTRYQCRH
jgi:hypothetical protein